MSLTKKEIEHLAKLARIDLTPQEIRKFKNQLSSILDYVAKLKKVNTKKTNATLLATTTENVSRKDRVESSKTRKELLKAAPEQRDHFYKVKAILK